MAFHVACPITCKRICKCKLGFPQKVQTKRGKSELVFDVSRLEDFLKDPWLFRVKDGATIQVPVPLLPPPPPPPPLPFVLAAAGDANADAVNADAANAELLLSAQTKRAALQKKAAVASLAAEDFARRFEAGVLSVVPKEIPNDSTVEEKGEVNVNTIVNTNVNAEATVNGSMNVNVMCRLCFSGEIEGTERAKKMLPCRTCGKKYHRNCMKTWSKHRDLFHWSSWSCPSCRICEVCCRTGEPTKLKFCKRCDGAFHCYCMQPPHKNVSSGPYLCPKHTKCHSCGSNVPGNGLSLRWFLGYTCCDACGRLFTKGNYCPVCLKVYRDSEATPMVCCDICQRWVHCQCDGISEERYLQFQVDRNLPYTCSTCRGESYQVRDLEDAVQELWRRKDEDDRDLTASLRAAAGLPTHEEIFSISPFSDDEDNGPVRSSKFSYKSLIECSPKKIKDPIKKPSNKKYGKKKAYQNHSGTNTELKLEDHDTQLLDITASEEMRVSHPDVQELFSSPINENVNLDRSAPIQKQGILNHKYKDDVTGCNADRQAASSLIMNKISDAGFREDVGKAASKPNPVKGTKLVIHLGGRNKTITQSPRSDSSSYQREQETMALRGRNEAASQHILSDSGVKKLDSAASLNHDNGVNIPHKVEEAKPRERNLIKLSKGKFASSDSNAKSERGNGLFAPENTHIMPSKQHSKVIVGTEGIQSTVSKGERVSSRKHSGNMLDTSDHFDRSKIIVGTEGLQSTLLKGGRVSSRKHPRNMLDISDHSDKSNKPAPSSVDASPKDSRPSLRFKIKTPYLGSWAPRAGEERIAVKGQRSKRKRPASLIQKPKDGEYVIASQDPTDEMVDAKWILNKLGRDVIGKRVEVHQPSDNSWHKGVVSDLVEGTSILSVDLDDGRAKRLDIGKQGIKFVQQKQKRLKS